MICCNFELKKLKHKIAGHMFKFQIFYSRKDEFKFSLFSKTTKGCLLNQVPADIATIKPKQAGSKFLIFLSSYFSVVLGIDFLVFFNENISVIPNRHC